MVVSKKTKQMKNIYVKTERARDEDLYLGRIVLNAGTFDDGRVGLD